MSTVAGLPLCVWLFMILFSVDISSIFSSGRRVATILPEGQGWLLPPRLLSVPAAQGLQTHRLPKPKARVFPSQSDPDREPEPVPHPLLSLLPWPVPLGFPGCWVGHVREGAHRGAQRKPGACRVLSCGSLFSKDRDSAQATCTDFNTMLCGNRWTTTATLGSLSALFSVQSSGLIII